MVDLHFSPALAADQVMVIRLGNFVDQVTAARLGRTNQSIFGQEFQRAVNSRFGQAGQVTAGTFENLGR